MKKTISKIIIRVVAIILMILSFNREVFAQELMGVAPNPRTTLTEIASTTLSWFLLILSPVSFLLSAIFFGRYFLLKRKEGEINKLKASASLRKGKVFLIIMILSVGAILIISIYNIYQNSYSYF